MAKKTIPTIDLNDYPYLNACKDSEFKKYVEQSKNGSHYELCEYLKANDINPHASVVQDLKSGTHFAGSDIDRLGGFTKNINDYVSGTNWINNFKPNKIDLHILFNEIAKSESLHDFETRTTLKSQLVGNLKKFIPYLFSIIKHCQDSDKYPIYYTLWNRLNEYSKWSTEGTNGYDKLCHLYNSIGIADKPKHVFFAAYMDYLVRQMLKKITPTIKDYKKTDLNYLFFIDPYKKEKDLLLEKVGKNAREEKQVAIDKAQLTAVIETESVIPAIYSHPLNLILYGPPGTGKTYNTLFHALAIIEGKTIEILREEQRQQDELKKNDPNKPSGYDVLKGRYDGYVQNGQIVFTTFHQSMSYEDFIEGIKPKTEMGRVTYEVQPGIFKQICENAKKISVANKSMGKVDFKKTRVFKMSLGEKDKDADAIFRYCVDNDVIALGWGKAINFSKCKKRADFQELDSTWGAAALEMFKEWMKKGDIVLISDGTKEVKGIAQVTGEYEFRDDPSIDMHQFRRVKWLYTGDNIPVSKLYDKNLSQQSIYGFYKEKNGIVNNGGIKVDVLNEIITGEVNEKKQDNYVLIIDEINRGNVSQIFGELITLIEKDKRIGKKEALSVTLPYSQTSFGVPDNLYIIGTMNTADRSVEALDTALRRRFSFEEMMPNPELLGETKVADIELKELLITLNKRIVALKDREHQIGHSYFMDCPDDEKAAEIWLNNVFKDKIIPLLQEYFYGDYKKIYYVLGGGFVKIVSEDNIFAVNIRDDFDIDEKTQRYEIKSSDEIQIGEAVNALMGIERKNDSGIPDKLESETGEESEESKH